MHRPSTQHALNQRKHIPAHIDQAMSQHMQQNMPAHLKKYVSPDRPAYIPQHIERQLAQQMQKNMPAHLKEYSGAYLEQKVVQPGSIRPAVAASAGATPHAPLPDRLRRDHSMFGSQHTVNQNNFSGNLPQEPQAQQPQQPLPPQQPFQPTQQPQAPQPAPYDFIMNPEQAPKKSRLPGSNSIAIRALMFSGLLLILLVGFTFVRGLLSGSSPLPLLVAVAQDQQALIQLTTAAGREQNMSVSNQNIAATAQVTLISAQAAMVNYLKENGQEVNANQLSLRVKAETAERLATAAAATTYNQTFQEIMREQLNNYISDLQQSSGSIKGQKGQTLLNDQYNQAQLLMTQLELAAATPS